MTNAEENAVIVVLSLVGVALFAELVSRNANGAGVIQSIGSGFSNSLGEALAPVTGSGGSIQTSYPGGGGSGSGFAGSSIGGVGGSGLGSFGATGGTASGASPLITSFSRVANSVAGFLGGGATGSYIANGGLASAYRGNAGGFLGSIPSDPLAGITSQDLSNVGLYTGP
jgi:hypothetical protein